jgi:outer membrane protein assembly factor BamB
VVAGGQGRWCLAPRSPHATLISFDPASGDPRWITTVEGEIVGGPAVRADGTVVVILVDPYASTYALASFDPGSGAQSIHPLASSAVEIFAITAGGVVIAGAEGGYGLTGLVALANDGTALWHNDGAENATIASDGTILASGIAGDGGPGPSIRAINPATGTTKWELVAPSSGACMVDFALTSERGIVGLQCDGTVFGASD